MMILQGPSCAPEMLRRPKVALGTFDGMHLGHQAVLRELLAWARETDSHAVAVTFDRKPRRVLSGGPLEQITTMPHRLRLFGQIGLDAVRVLEFTRALAETAPEEFVRRHLLGELGISGVLMGHDTRFGHKGRGDSEMMAALGRTHGFEVRAMPVVEIYGEPVSSTRVRRVIHAGNLDEAARLLGRRFSLYGKVVHGTGRGKEFGFPTANLDVRHVVQPPQGVYVTRACVGGMWYPAVTNIGRPPSLAAKGPAFRSDEIVVETHIMDFSGDLYGSEIEVQFVEMIRTEQKFTSPVTLAERITADVAIARERLARLRASEQAV